jgi:hypothetical protein
MSLVKFIGTLTAVNRIIGINQVCFKSISADSWQVELKFVSDGVSSIFNINLYGKITVSRGRYALKIDMNRIDLPRTDAVSVGQLAKILTTLDHFGTMTIPLDRAKVRAALHAVNIDEYTWAGTVWQYAA